MINDEQYIYKYITCQLKYDINNNKQFYNKIIYN